MTNLQPPSRTISGSCPPQARLNLFRGIDVSALGLAALLCLAATPHLLADLVQWDGEIDDLFNTPGNWDEDTVPADGDDLIFGSLDTGNQLVDLNGESFNIGSIIFQGSESYTITNSGGAASLSMSDGSLIVNNSSASQTLDIELFAEGDLTIRATFEDLIFTEDANLDFTSDDDSTLTFTGGNDVTFDGIISNSGDGDTELIKFGSGTLTLNNANTYSGETTLNGGVLEVGHDDALGTSGVLNINGGTLQATGGAVALDEEIIIDANFEVSGDEDLTLSGDMNGEGDLTKTGEGTLTLSGDMYERIGDTFINEGTLLLDSTSDDVFDDESMIVLADTEGAMLDLNGHDETIGSLIGGGSEGGDINLGAGTLTIAGDATTTYGGIISGTGGLTIGGSTTLRLQGESTFTGLTNVLDGARLEGDGAVGGDLTLNSGAEFAPGSGAVGEFNVGGNYLQDTGSTVFIELGGAGGAADQILVDGSATLANNSNIVASIVGSSYLPTGSDITIISAGAGVTDNGVDISSTSATVTFLVDDDFADGQSDFALEVFRSANAYSNAAVGQNNLVIAAQLDQMIALADANPTGEVANLLGPLDALDQTAINAAIAQLSPEPYNTSTLVAIDGSQAFMRYQARYLNARRWMDWNGQPENGGGELQQAFAAPINEWNMGAGSLAFANSQNDPAMLANAIAAFQDGEAAAEDNNDRDPRLGTYFKAYGIHSSLDTLSDRTGYQANTYGGQVGVDYRFTDTLRLGFAGGYARTEADLDNNLGEIDVDSIRFGPYFTFSCNPWYVDGSVSYGYNMYEGERDISAIGLTADSDYDGYEISAYLGAGYHIDLNDWLFLTPTGSLHYSNFSFDEYTESGAGAANLIIEDRDDESLRSRLGFTLATELGAGKVRIRPDVSIGWEHEFFTNEDIEATFAAAGNQFVIDTGTREHDSLLLGAGITSLFPGGESFFVRYDAAIANDGDVHAVTAGLQLRF